MKYLIVLLVLLVGCGGTIMADVPVTGATDKVTAYGGYTNLQPVTFAPAGPSGTTYYGGGYGAPSYGSTPGTVKGGAQPYYAPSAYTGVNNPAYSSPDVYSGVSGSAFNPNVQTWLSNLYSGNYGGTGQGSSTAAYPYVTSRTTEANLPQFFKTPPAGLGNISPMAAWTIQKLFPAYQEGQEGVPSLQYAVDENGKPVNTELVSPVVASGQVANQLQALGVWPLVQAYLGMVQGEVPGFGQENWLTQMQAMMPNTPRSQTEWRARRQR